MSVAIVHGLRRLASARVSGPWSGYSTPANAGWQWSGALRVEAVDTEFVRASQHTYTKQVLLERDALVARFGASFTPRLLRAIQHLAPHDVDYEAGCQSERGTIAVLLEDEG
ncbi:hypothetical protein PQR08_36425 [Caballeronia jiangsuensis]|uniref:Uncharacterized protein n=1 Tax=Caballeronia jiangsuensis TaxID=1458357 RepID=A0ABW9CZQ2_9BURK|nr:hypothetical protein [Caballeronia sp. GaOx3]